MSEQKPLHWGGPLACTLAAVVLCLLIAAFRPVAAQDATHTEHSGHGHHAAPAPAPSGKEAKPAETKKTATKKHVHPAKRHVHSGKSTASHQHGTRGAHEHGSGAQHEGYVAAMKAFLGPYPMTREASGTSWQPDSSPHEGIHWMYGDWQFMSHALINGVYDHQGGARGGDKTFVSGMLMAMAERSLGDGTLGFRAMLSPDPFMGPNGYPLLFATGETADGRTPLIDRQHPHDLFMELAGSYSRNLSTTSSVFVYAGLPGEPALGPPALMHRTSGMDIPEAPMSHHWLDSTHITYGVVTLGAVMNTWKIEGSVFRGREPDQYRFDIEQPWLDSFSARVSWNPIRELSLQVSWGRLHSPEQLAPNVNEDRITASAIYTQPFVEDNLWSTTFAWGRKMNNPGNTLDGFLVESELILKRTYTVFMRAERVAEDELLDVPMLQTFGNPAPIFTVTKLTFGGIYDFPVADHLKFGVGGLVSKYGVPGDLKPVYSSDPTSYMLFFRLKVS